MRVRIVTRASVVLAAVVAATAAAVAWLSAAEPTMRGQSRRLPAVVRSPPGMVYVPGGATHIGSASGLADEQPVFVAHVQPFFLDVHPVTVAQFRQFIAETGHVTDAERLGDGGVYDIETGEWRLVPGANWRRPRGAAGEAAADDHPATQVSWNDAVAYARWIGKRLPTEIEWEHAARGARDNRSRYPWGNELVFDGEHRANTWQGGFPGGTRLEDGYLYTSPVGAFGRTALGLADMAGNVWEWTCDWYRPYPLDNSRPATSPLAGGDELFGGREKVQRGGSFLCNPAFCHGYRVSARSHATPETSHFHVGFRLAKDLGDLQGQPAEVTVDATQP